MFEAIVSGIVSGIISGIVTGIVLFFLTRWYNKKMGLIERYKCPNPECGKLGLYNGEGVGSGVVFVVNQQICL